MDEITSNTNLEVKKEDLYKALFCDLCFDQLKTFLSDFDITNNKNTLDMSFLLTAYDHVNGDNRRECHWKLGEIKDNELMVAIEEFFKITSNEFNGDNLEKERNKILHYLFENENDDQISLGDNTLKQILKHFGFLDIIDPKFPEMRGMSNEIKKLLTNSELPNHYSRYCYAIDLQACVRNWKGHRFNPVFMGTALHLYHRFVLFAYIGLVYVFRKIWTDPNCCKQLNKGITIERGKEKVTLCFFKPQIIDDFKIPLQKVHLTIPKTQANIDRCLLLIEEGNKEPKKEKIQLIRDSDGVINFDINVRKYESFKINIITKSSKGEKNNPIPFELNYRSWFYNYTIIIPPGSKAPSYNGGADNQSYNTLLEMLARIEDKDEKTRSVIREEFGKIRDMYFSSVCSHDNNSETIETIKNYLSTINDSLKDGKEILKGVNNSNQKIENYLSDYYNRIKKNNEEAKRQRTLIDAKISWLSYFILLIIGLWFPCYFYFSRINATISFINYKWYYILAAVLTTVLATVLFASMQDSFSIKGKLLGLKYYWIPIVVIPLVSIICFSKVPYTSIDDLINNYTFSDKGNDKDWAVFMEEQINNNNNNPRVKERLAIKLGEYYSGKGEDIDKSAAVTEFMLKNYSTFPKGALYAIECLYRKCLLHNDDYTPVKDEISLYDSSAIKRPSTINWIEGHMYYYGKGHQAQPVKGEKLIRIASDMKDPKAQYLEGRIHSYINYIRGNEVGTDTLYDLNKAIYYYQQASKTLPEASLELGKLYADINMEDSAKKYLNDAIEKGIGPIYAEANYRLGLLFTNDNNKKNKYILEARENKYKPAYLYVAKCDTDIISVIDYYKKAGNYFGHKYLPPIALAYIEADSLDTALDVLKKTRPNGKFNEDFITGAQLFINSKTPDDSIKGLSILKKSANQGCYYAKMICQYLKIREDINKGDYSLTNIDSLEILAKRHNIVFSYILISDLYQEKGRHEEAIKDIEAARNNYKIAEDMALIALRSGHPAGIKMLGDMRLSGFNYQYNSNGRSFYQLKKEKSHHHLMLRFSDRKYYNILSGFFNDHRLFVNVNGKDEDYQLPNKEFWSDVAIANHHFEAECSLLNFFTNEEEEYIKKLIHASIKDIEFSVSSKGEGSEKYLNYRINILSNYPQYNSFLSKLYELYKNDNKRNYLFNKVDLEKLEGSQYKAHFSWINKKTVFNKKSLFNELSNLFEIEDRLYDNP